MELSSRAWLMHVLFAINVLYPYHSLDEISKYVVDHVAEGSNVLGAPSRFGICSRNLTPLLTTPLFFLHHTTDLTLQQQLITYYYRGTLIHQERSDK